MATQLGHAVHFIWMCLVVFLSLQRVDAVSAHYRSLRDVPGLLDRNVSTGATSAFSSPAVYKDANKLHVLPFSMLAVVESRYDVLRVHGLFHEFAHKFPKKPYVAVLAVELPRRNGSSDGQGAVGSMRLKNFLNFLKFKEHASVDLSYLQYDAALPAEIEHHVYHYMRKMTTQPSLLVTVGHSVTAVAAVSVARLFAAPVVQLSTRGSDRHASNDQAVLTDRWREAVAAEGSAFILGDRRPPPHRADIRRKTVSVGSLLHDTIHMGLTLTVKQLTEYGAMLKRGDTGVSSDVNLPYLVVGCSYACSNLIDKASHKAYVRAVSNLASVHSDRRVFLLLDEERPEYTYYSSNRSLYGSGDGDRERYVSSLFAGIGNVAVLSPIGDYAIYVNLILAADVYIADCDMAEGFISEEVESLGVRSVLLSLPPSAEVQCPLLGQAHTLIYPPVDESGAKSRVLYSRDAMLEAVRDVLRTRPSVQPSEGIAADGLSSKRAACHIARHFFAQGMPGYLKKYCSTVSEDTRQRSESGETPARSAYEDVTLVYRRVDLRSDFASCLRVLFQDSDESLNSEDINFRSRLRRVVLFHGRSEHSRILNESVVTAELLTAGLCCHRSGLTSWACGRSIPTAAHEFSCSIKLLDVQFVSFEAKEVLLELAAIALVAETAHVVLIDHGYKPQLNALRSLVNATAVHSAVSGPVGYIMTKEDVYRSEEVPSCLEVDFVQGMWSLKKEWLREVIAGTAEEISENNLPSIHVLLSSLLWSRLGIRTLVPAIEAPVTIIPQLSAHDAARASRIAVKAGFIPCGLRAAPLYSGRRCCDDLDSDYCEAVYRSLFGPESDHMPPRHEDNLAGFFPQ